MTRYYLVKTALVLYSLISDQNGLRLQKDTGIGGNWVGNYQTVPLGKCSWKVPTIPVTATFRTVNDSIIGTVTPPVGSTAVPINLRGRLTGSTISLAQANDAICYGTLRTYVNHFEATLQRDKLTIISYDTLCPEQDCIFLRTLTLARP